MLISPYSKSFEGAEADQQSATVISWIISRLTLARGPRKSHWSIRWRWAWSTFIQEILSTAISRCDLQSELGLSVADIQATNVLVNDMGNINICDFGLSQLKLDMKRRSKEKIDPSGKGTMRWLSPERMKGGPLTWKCDVYSFAMVIFEVSMSCR
jgi:serine/threonine protein kinase